MSPDEGLTPFTRKDSDVGQADLPHGSRPQLRDTDSSLESFNSNSNEDQVSLTIPNSNTNSPSVAGFTPPRLSSQNFRRMSGMSSIHSLVKEDLSGDEYNGEEDRELGLEDLLNDKPDPLHTIEKPYPRQGRSRYIIESDRTFTIFSLRGFLNLGAVFSLLGVLLFLFGIWPIYAYANRHVGSKHDLENTKLSKLSGPFEASDLPQRLL
ncbi:hypothetical protein CROQUDRAFT_673064 [Cronartium quercuum f. sp. fusiforme G11]|uniref:Uncharacterized protein n=1 Tax=Cronartium quercuum f. sp. fusiforme G11 TaxID=708437 RepID=A0A9P6T8Q2_9BASI|nr:hypothetical protein CROQUDRAFT_673064 [Cronartium quercuum f. sp. fusiforme G11]